jgi:hypothetical protein
MAGSCGLLAAAVAEMGGSATSALSAVAPPKKVLSLRSSHISSTYALGEMSPYKQIFSIFASLL